MYAKLIIKALIAFFITLGGALMTLFTGPDVHQFTDITQVQYAVAVISSVLSALALLQAQLSDSPDNVQQTNSIVSAAANLKQGGFANIRFLMIACTLATSFLVACAAMTPNKTIDATSIVIQDLAIQIGGAQKSGQITNAQEDSLLDQLKKINGDLRLAVYLLGDQKTQSLTAINNSLNDLKAQLSQETTK